MPSLLFADLKQVALWGKVFHHLSPGDILWPFGTKVNQISADIIKGIERMIKQAILDFKVPAGVEVGITEEGLLKILVWAFGDQYYPIFYKETLEAVKPISTKLQELVQEALILMGSHTLMNWEDVKYMLDDQLEMMYEDEIEQAEMRKKYKKCGPAVSPFIRGEKGELKRRVDLFAKTVQRLKPRGEKQKLVAEMLRAVVDVLGANSIFEFAPEDYEDMHIELGRIMPILYTGIDDLSDFHYEEMNGHWQGGGAIFGEQLEFVTDPEYLKGSQILKRLDRFLGEIRILSLYEKIFSIIDDLTRKEGTANEPDLHTRPGDDHL